MSLEKFDVWGTWMQELDIKADNTRRSYLLYFNRFCNRWDVTPDVLYEMRKADLSGEPIERKRIERMVKTSMSETLKSGFTAGTAIHTSKAVGSFFESMGMELQFKNKDFPRGEYKGSIVITKPQIVKIYEEMIIGLRLRNRAILLSLKDSGLRVSDIAAMDYGFWLQAETIQNQQGETFKVFDPELTQKMKVIAYVHLGPESVAAIQEYLRERQDSGEVLTDESPLFLNRYGKRMHTNAISNIIRKRVRNLGFKRVSAHSLRKFHTTKLEKEMRERWINKLQGKKTSVYSQPEEDISEKYPGFSVLTEKYIDSYDVLRVLDKSWDQIENERLREELERAHAQGPPEWTAMQEEINSLKSQIDQIKADAQNSG